jgi:serine phosphatase RsbU (regulator of sigma subunit)
MQSQLERPQSQQLYAALNHEKHIADTLQRAMLRTIPEDNYPGWSVAAIHEAAWDEALVSGDFYDMFRLEDGKIAIVIGDAMGKGLSAALHTSGIKAVLRLLLREQPSPATALERLNLMLCDAERMDDLTASGIIACAIAVIDPNSGKTIVSSAGMESPLLLKATGTRSFCAQRVNIDSGLLLGVCPNAEFVQTTVHLHPGDLLITVTDGITEARYGRHDFFGYEGFTAAAVEGAEEFTVTETGRHILNAAHEFAGGRLHDDACIVLMRRNP